MKYDRVGPQFDAFSYDATEKLGPSLFLNRGKFWQFSCGGMSFMFTSCTPLVSCMSCTSLYHRCMSLFSWHAMRASFISWQEWRHSRHCMSSHACYGKGELRCWGTEGNEKRPGVREVGFSAALRYIWRHFRPRDHARRVAARAAKGKVTRNSAPLGSIYRITNRKARDRSPASCHIHASYIRHFDGGNALWRCIASLLKWIIVDSLREMDSAELYFSG